MLVPLLSRLLPGHAWDKSPCPQDLLIIRHLFRFPSIPPPATGRVVRSFSRRDLEQFKRCTCRFPAALSVAYGAAVQEGLRARLETIGASRPPQGKETRMSLDSAQFKVVPNCKSRRRLRYTYMAGFGCRRGSSMGCENGCFCR